MLLNTCQPEADKALLQLGRRLQADGYRFTCVTPLTQQRNNERQSAARARTLRDIFGWNRPFTASLLSADELAQMRVAQILDEDGDCWRSRVRWSSLEDLLFVHSGFPTTQADAVFFGPDSYRFAHFIASHLQGRFIDQGVARRVEREGLAEVGRIRAVVRCGEEEAAQHPERIRPGGEGPAH